MPNKDTRLLTLHEYISSVREYEKSITNNKNMPEGRAVANSNGSVSFLDEVPYLGYFKVDWAESFAKAKHLITKADIKAHYIAQLEEMQLPAELLADDKLQNKLQAAKQAALLEPINLTLPDLLLAVNQRLEVSLRSGNISNVLYDKDLTEFGLHNALSARIQNPRATKIITSQSLSELRANIKAEEKPIKIFTPVIRSFFERSGKLLPVPKATEQEQFDIINNKLPVHQAISYNLKFGYDISQLELPVAELQKLYEPNQVSYTCEEFKKFVEVIKVPSFGGIKLKETPMQGMTLDSIYSKADKSIVINSELHETRKMSEYIKRISDAVIDLTSPSVPMLKAFEAQLLSFQLHAACELSPSMIDTDKLTSTFIAAENNISFAKTGTFAKLEGTFARVNRASSYVKNGISHVAAGISRANSQEQSQQQALSQGSSKSPATEELKNFMNQI